MVHIRAATPADVPLILELIRGLAEYEKLGQACVATEERLAGTLFGAKPFAETIIAEWDGTPAGFALFFHNYSTFLAQPGIYLEDLFVKPEFRGKGIGRALLSRLAKIAEERNCGRVEWAVLDWNQPSIEFYKSLGAQPLDDWTTFRLTEPAIANLARGGLIWSAIDQRRMLRLHYKDRERIVEPHDYGVHKGVPKLLAYQTAGSSSQKLPNWRWMEEDLITSVELLDRTFPGGRGASSERHHKWDRLFIRVKPAEGEE